MVISRYPFRTFDQRVNNGNLWRQGPQSAYAPPINNALQPPSNDPLITAYGDDHGDDVRTESSKLSSSNIMEWDDNVDQQIATFRAATSESRRERLRSIKRRPQTASNTMNGRGGHWSESDHKRPFTSTSTIASQRFKIARPRSRMNHRRVQKHIAKAVNLNAIECLHRLANEEDVLCRPEDLVFEVNVDLLKDAAHEGLAMTMCDIVDDRLRIESSMMHMRSKLLSGHDDGEICESIPSLSSMTLASQIRMMDIRERERTIENRRLERLEHIRRNNPKRAVKRANQRLQARKQQQQMHY